MSRFQPVPYDDSAEMNLSPMLDVVFIMLIFFIVVATFVHEKGLSITLPPPVQIPPDAVESIAVRVEGADTYIVNGRAMSAASVRPYVQALHAENPEAGYAVLLESGTTVKDAVVAIEAGRLIGIDVVPVMPAE